MLAGFGKMETVAGRVLGGIPSGNEACNDWNAAWEGGPATDADLSRPQSWIRTRSLGQPR